VLAGLPSRVAGRPPSPASTDFKLWILCYCLLESVPVKQTHERLQSGANSESQHRYPWDTLLGYGEKTMALGENVMKDSRKFFEWFRLPERNTLRLFFLLYCY
jgi:hypothetical protein